MFAVSGYIYAAVATASTRVPSVLRRVLCAVMSIEGLRSEGIC